MKRLKMPKTDVTRRDFMRVSAMATAGTVLVACGAGGEPAADAPMEEAPADSTEMSSDMPASQYNEAPRLAEMVANGDLPPVDERLPVNPLVLEGLDGVGNYGGLWRAGFRGQADHFALNQVLIRGILSINQELTVNPMIAESWSVSDDATEYIFNLREGMKWSSGESFSSADFVFWFEEEMKNETLTPVFPGWLTSPVDGVNVPVELTAPDDTTVIFKFAGPNALFHLEGGVVLSSPVRSAAYMKQFHPDYAEKAALDKMIADTEVENWVQLMKQKCNGYQNLEKPTTNAWIVIDGSEGPQWIFERNPYYNVVDTAGNQLPYLDYVVMTLVQDTEVGALKALAGEIDMQGRHMRPDKLPLLLEFQEVGGYRVHQYLSPSPADWGFWINQSYDEDPVIGDLLRKRDFRTALKISVDREELKEAVFAGSGEIRDYAPAEGSLFDVGPELRYYDVERDLDRANALLDGIGLTARDSDGYRMRPDGDGRITLRWDIRPREITPVEFVIQHWKDIGIDSTFNVDPRQHVIHRANKGYLQPVAGGPGWNCWIAAHSCAPASTPSHIAVEVGRWYSTGGAQGEDPVSDKYKNEDGRYIMKELLDAYEEGFSHSMTSPRRKELAKFLYETYIKEALAINVVGSTSGFKGLFVVNDDMRNVPDPRTVVQGGFYNLPPRMELYYYENPSQHLHYTPR
jgi:peptide/nickel transport system substrate-binding protein